MILHEACLWLVAGGEALGCAPLARRWANHLDTYGAAELVRRLRHDVARARREHPRHPLTATGRKLALFARALCRAAAC